MGVFEAGTGEAFQKEFVKAFVEGLGKLGNPASCPDLLDESKSKNGKGSDEPDGNGKRGPVEGGLGQ